MKQNIETIMIFLFRFVMAELLQTERTYVKDLEVCITVWENKQLSSFTVFFLKLTCKILLDKKLQTHQKTNDCCQRSEVDDFIFFQTYLNEAMEPDNNVPQGIMGKHKIIFCNMEEIYDFHKKWVFFIYKLSF